MENYYLDQYVVIIVYSGLVIRKPKQ